MPVRRRKTLEKWLWSANPALSAISARGRAPATSCSAARSIRRRRRYSPTVQPKVRRKARASVTGWTPTASASSARVGREVMSAWSRSRASPSQGALPAGAARCAAARPRPAAPAADLRSPAGPRRPSGGTPGRPGWRSPPACRRGRRSARPAPSAWLRIARARSRSDSTSSPRASPRSKSSQCRSPAGMTLSVSGVQVSRSPPEVSVNTPCNTKQRVGPSWWCQGRLAPGRVDPSVRVKPATRAVLSLVGPGAEAAGEPSAVPRSSALRKSRCDTKPIQIRPRFPRPCPGCYSIYETYRRHSSLHHLAGRLYVDPKLILLAAMPSPRGLRRRWRRGQRSPAAAIRPRWPGRRCRNNNLHAQQLEVAAGATVTWVWAAEATDAQRHLRRRRASPTTGRRAHISRTFGAAGNLPLPLHHPRSRHERHPGVVTVGRRGAGVGWWRRRWRSRTATEGRPASRCLAEQPHHRLLVFAQPGRHFGGGLRVPVAPAPSSIVPA